MKLALTERSRAKSRRNRKVSRSVEFRRIEALPRRDWTEEQSRLGLILSLDDGEITLWNIQEAALREAMQMRGLFGAIAVGKGKAFVSVLAAVVMGAERPMLLVPASLRDQTNQMVLPLLRKHFHLHTNLRVLAYNELSQIKNADIIDEINPDLIIADEAHMLKHKKSGKTRRVIRWMKAHPETMFMALGGSMARTSIRDYAHILEWCLGNQSPLPRTWREQNDWADALDVDVLPQNRVAPGALNRFDSDNPRAGYRGRLTETRGVIVSGEDELAVGLRILKRDVTFPKPVARALHDMLQHWEVPDGRPIEMAVEMWRHARELACGFYYKWTENPPVEWSRARTAWAHYITHTKGHNRRNLDTDKQVWNDAKAQSPQPEEFVAWNRIKDTYKPKRVPVWLDDFLLNDAMAWMDENAGIVWTEHIAVGERLAELSGRRYYGGGANDIIHASGPIIASVKAHSVGKNLQHTYHSNLILLASSSGETWEQLLARTHRPYQPADIVTAETYQHTQGLREALQRAFVNAEWLQETMGARQKLLFADLGTGIVRG